MKIFSGSAYPGYTPPVAEAISWIYISWIYIVGGSIPPMHSCPVRWGFSCLPQSPIVALNALPARGEGLVYPSVVSGYTQLLSIS